MCWYTQIPNNLSYDLTCLITCTIAWPNGVVYYIHGFPQSYTKKKKNSYNSKSAT